MSTTLLRVVQSVLSAMESDNVNSISDTTESISIAKVAEETFFEMLSQSDWPHLETTIKLVSTSDSERPSFLEIPVETKYIKGFWYDDKKVKYLEPVEFISFVNNRNEDMENVSITNLENGVRVKIFNDRDPEYFTTFNQKEIALDSFDRTEGATLVADKSYALASIIPKFTLSDDYVIGLPQSVMPTYLAMVKRSCFLYFRRESSPKDERAALSGLGRILRDNSVLHRKTTRINYGRNK